MDFEPSGIMEFILKLFILLYIPGTKNLLPRALEGGRRDYFRVTHLWRILVLKWEEKLMLELPLCQGWWSVWKLEEVAELVIAQQHPHLKFLLQSLAMKGLRTATLLLVLLLLLQVQATPPPPVLRLLVLIRTCKSSQKKARTCPFFILKGTAYNFSYKLGWIKLNEAIFFVISRLSGGRDEMCNNTTLSSSTIA